MAVPAPRELLLGAFGAALAAVEPAAAVRRALRRNGDVLVLGDAGRYEIGSGRIRVIGLGKAAVPMARAVREICAGLPVSGVIVSHDPAPIDDLAVMRGGHPRPDAGSVAAGEAILAEAQTAAEGDLIVCVISGGGSALAEVPAPGLDLDDLLVVSGLLLRSGAPIDEINTVRKHLSSFKGGRLGAALAPARVFTLVLSDVAGSPLDVIASGPTVADATTSDDALAVIERYRLRDGIPPRVIAHLETGGAPTGRLASQEIVIVGDGAAAADAAAGYVFDTGIPAAVVATDLTGEARDQGERAADRLLTESGPSFLVWAGETTVTVRGPGRGGRCQEAALGAARVLEGHERVAVAALATDGRDGPTDAAGAIVDGGTVARGSAAGFDPDEALAANDSYPILDAAGDLVFTGPTGTNVADLIFAYRAQ